MQERRKKRRFAFKQQVIFKIQEDGEWTEFRGITENVSETGVLMLVESIAPVLINATVVVGLHDVPLRLSCHGTIVRVEQRVETRKVAVAVRCNHGFAISKNNISNPQI